MSAGVAPNRKSCFRRRSCESRQPGRADAIDVWNDRCCKSAVVV
jgi:hypothetical protein